MIRRFVRLALWISLLLCVAIMTALWVRSLSHTDQYGHWKRWRHGHFIEEDFSGVVFQQGAFVIATMRYKVIEQFWPGYGEIDPSAKPHLFDTIGWSRDPACWRNVRFKRESGIGIGGICYGTTPSPEDENSLSFGSSVDGSFLRIPFALPITVILLWPVLLASRYFFRRYRLSARIGRCASCGYDLTGNTSGVCPECGTARIR